MNLFNVSSSVCQESSSDTRCMKTSIHSAISGLPEMPEELLHQNSDGVQNVRTKISQSDSWWHPQLQTSHSEWARDTRTRATHHQPLLKPRRCCCCCVNVCVCSCGRFLVNTCISSFLNPCRKCCSELNIREMHGKTILQTLITFSEHFFCV